MIGSRMVVLEITSHEPNGKSVGLGRYERPLLYAEFRRAVYQNELEFVVA
jgi:hypothetical protein